MEYLLNYFLQFLNYLEDSRKYIYEATGKWADKREMALEYVNKLESHFKNYHPFTLIIGFFILFFVIRYLLKKLRNIWRAISKLIINLLIFP